MLYRFSAAISYNCYLFTFLLVYIVLILDCVGYFHRPKKPLISVPLHTYQRMFFASAIAATDKTLCMSPIHK